MTIPALKRLSPAQYQAFRQIVEALTAADGKIDLFEYCLRVILFGYLDVQFGLRPAPAVRFKAVSAVAQPAIIILSALAYAGQSQPDDIQRAFQAGASDLLGQVRIVPPQQCTFDTFDAALGQLAQASPAVKRQILEAVVACIAADGKMTIVENEFLRAVAAALSCPLPPVPVRLSASGSLRKTWHDRKPDVREARAFETEEHIPRLPSGLAQAPGRLSG